MLNTDLVLDFNEINRLSSHDKDPIDSGYTTTFVYSKSRKVISEMIDYYLEYNKPHSSKFKKNEMSDEHYQYVIKTLLYNKILVSFRDSKILDIIE